MQSNPLFPPSKSLYEFPKPSFISTFNPTGGDSNSNPSPPLSALGSDRRMDPKDPTPSPAAVKDVASESEEELSSIHEALANEASHLFRSHRYSECLDVLKQLLKRRKDDTKKEDPKVLHNITVAEYFLDGGSDPKKLVDALNDVKEKCEILTSGEQLEDVGSTGSSSMAESRGSSSQLQLSVADTDNVPYADEFDTSVVVLNIATIYYHLREYQETLSCLWPLYQNIAPIDEGIALHVCILLLDTTLALQDASKASDVIQYLEKAFVGSLINQGDNGSNVQHQSSNQGMKFSAATSTNILAQDASGSDSSAGTNITETPLMGTLSDDAREYENLYSTLDSGGQHVGRPTSNDLSKASAVRVVPEIDLKQKLHLYKVRLLLLTGNQKAAMREVKLAMNDVRGRDSSTELILKAQLEYSRDNHSKAIKLLQASRNQTETATLIILNNNLGCIHHELGKNSVSCVFFSKALTSSRSLLSEKPLKLSTFSQDKSLLISYNLGLQSLLSGKPYAAACYFSKAAPMFDNRPLFWLRTAECSLLALKECLLRKKGESSSNEEIKLHVIDSGKSRNLIVDDTSIRESYSVSEPQDESFSNMLSLRLARQSLAKALILLDKVDLELKSESPAAAAANDDPKETRAGPGSNTTFQSSIESYADTCQKENHVIRQAILADLAFVTLCLEDPIGALSASKSLLRVPNCSKTHIFLGRVYAAEALGLLGRGQEVMEEISVFFPDDNHFGMPYSVEERDRWGWLKAGDSEGLKSSKYQKGWLPLTPEEARGTLFANIAALLAKKGDFEQAAQMAKEAVFRLPNDPRAVLTAVYVDLKLGKAQEAVAKLRESRCVRFLRAGVPLTS